MKQMLSIDEQIAHMKERGIRFHIVSEESAREFLQQDSYYYKVSAYRALYPKCPPGTCRAGEYQNLEFAYLQELSRIDTHLRYLIMGMCLDIEHAIKVRLVIAATQNPAEDGYHIVQEYIRREDPRGKMLNSIAHHKSGEYCRDLIHKYHPNYPLWALMEVITFGDLIHLCSFYERVYDCHLIPNNKLINIVRDLRNTAAHSNCMLNQLGEPMESSKQANASIVSFVRGRSGISPASINKNVRKRFVYNMLTLLYVYNTLVPSSTCKTRYVQLQAFMHSDVVCHSEYFASNSQITGVYRFLQKIVDAIDQQ